MTWVRESDLIQADKAFDAAAQAAHAQGLSLFEVRAYRTMAMYQVDDGVALDLLRKAESALSHNKKTMSDSDREEERARILRARVVRAIHAGDDKLPAKAMQQLEAMAQNSRSTVIQQSYHGAQGAMLVAQQKYQDAIPHLEEDTSDPYSLQLLSRAYHETGAASELHAVEARLRGINMPTIEQALVVVPTRAKRPE
jgi:hypothetical protein